VPIERPATRASDLLLFFSSATNRISMPLNTLALPANSNFAATLVRIWARIRTSQFWMVAIAFILRVGWILVAHTYQFKSTEHNFSFGWEMGRIGAALASGQASAILLGRRLGPRLGCRPSTPI